MNRHYDREAFLLNGENIGFMVYRRFGVGGPPHGTDKVTEALGCRYKLTCMKSSEKNRFQNAFPVCNVALDSVVSDRFGKSAAAITDYLTSDEDFDPRHCVSLLRRSLKKKAGDVLASIEGYEISPEQKYRSIKDTGF